MHFPYYFLIKKQCFEKLTKGTALGGLSPPNNKPMSPLLKRPTANHVFWAELKKQYLF